MGRIQLWHLLRPPRVLFPHSAQVKGEWLRPELHQHDSVAHVCVGPSLLGQ